MLWTTSKSGGVGSFAQRLSKQRRLIAAELGLCAPINTSLKQTLELLRKQRGPSRESGCRLEAASQPAHTHFHLP